MHTLRKITLFLIAVSGVGLAVTTTPQIPPQKNTPQAPPRKLSKAERAEYESQFPIADYESSEPEDPDKRQKRRAKNRRHDGRGLVAKPENSGADQATTRFNDWDMQISPLPVAQSNAVVIGEVAEARAYLSDDKSGVYSEFSLRADRVLMESGGVTIAPGSMIVVEREGGRVRFSPGVVELYEIAGQGMPRIGHRYVLFLRSTGEEQGYSITTGYEVLGNRILPLDKRNVSKSEFDVYKDMNLDDFLRTVERAITQFRQARQGGD